MAMGDKTVFDEFVKEIIKNEHSDHLDALSYASLKTGTITGTTREESEFIPDESYKTGPWLVHIIPHEINNGFEKVHVCKACMTIGKGFLNSNICSLCGSKENEIIVAQWIKRPWYKRWFRKHKGHWESSDVD